MRTPTNIAGTANGARYGRNRHLVAAATAALALSSPLLGGSLGATASAVEPAAEPSLSAASTVYTRFELRTNRWAVNTGFSHGDKTDGANAQTWSWTHRQPHDWNSQWDRDHVADGYGTYRNRWSNLCLGVDNVGFANRVEQQKCDGRPGQLWDAVSTGTSNGRTEYALKNKAISDKLHLDMVMAADHTNIGAPVTVRVMSAAASTERWYISHVTG